MANITVVFSLFLLAASVTAWQSEYIPGTTIRVLSARRTLSAPKREQLLGRASIRQGDDKRRRVKGTFWFEGEKFGGFQRKTYKYNFTNEENMAFNRQAYELAFGDEFNLNDPFAELGEEFGEGFGPEFGDFTKVQRLRKEAAKKRAQMESNKQQTHSVQQEAELASKPQQMGDNFPNSTAPSPAPSPPATSNGTYTNDHHKTNDVQSKSPNVTYKADGDGNYHFRRGKLDKTEMPMTCTCKKGRWGRGTCYYFTDESIGACNRRDCLPKYVCIAPSRHGIQCMRRKMKTRIVATGMHTCVRKQSNQMQYVPYTVS